MKIIDFETKGNVIKLYLGTNDDYWGDDWDDTPYEHNAGKVYSEFIEKSIEFAFPVNFKVLTPEDDWHYNGNSPYCKEDFKNRKAPCIIIINDDEYYDSYSEYLGNSNAISIYFNDDIESTKTKLIEYGGTILN